MSDAASEPHRAYIHPSYARHADSHSSDWSLTVIRTIGIQFKPPEKSWRPSVRLHIPAHPDLDPSSLVLGRDGQVQNAHTTSLKLHGVNHRCRISVRLMHGSQKHRARQHLVATACISLGELAERQRRMRKRAMDPLCVPLAFPNPNERSPTVCYVDDNACLLVRLNVPPDYWETVSATGTSDAEMSSACEEDALFGSSSMSSLVLSENASEGDKASTEQSDTDVDESMLKPTPTARRPSSSASNDGSMVSTCRAFAYPPTPIQHPAPSDNTAVPAQQLSRDASDGDGERCDARPAYTWPERLLSAFTPYAELAEAEGAPEDQRDERIEGVLKRLQKEWSLVAASLLALAGINAAIFGLAPGSDFPIDGPARRVTVLGAITAGLGLFLDSLVVFRYYNAAARAFRDAAADADGTYFYFCVCCRAPTVCMLVSATCLAAFLLIVAWAEWPSAVVVLSLLAGVVVTLQFLVYGVRRTLGCVGWCVRGVRRELGGSRAARMSRGSSIHG